MHYLLPTSPFVLSFQHNGIHLYNLGWGWFALESVFGGSSNSGSSGSDHNWTGAPRQVLSLKNTTITVNTVVSSDSGLVDGLGWGEVKVWGDTEDGGALRCWLDSARDWDGQSGSGNGEEGDDWEVHFCCLR